MSAGSTFTFFDVTARPRSFSSFTPKLGLNYQWTPDVFQYLSYARGFKSGGYDLRTNTAIGSQTPYLPQILTTYEAGLKTRLFAGRLTANVAIFYNDITDLQVRASSAAALGPVTNQLLNAGSATSQGAELEVSAAPVRGLQVSASAAYLRTRYESFTATLPANVPGRTTLLGLDFPLSPRWQVGGSASYRLPLAGPGAWRIGVDVQYESKRYGDIFNTEQTATRAQTFANGSIGYTTEDRQLTVGVRVDNIFDLRRAQTATYVPANAGVYPTYYRAYNEPRMANVFIDKSF